MIRSYPESFEVVDGEQEAPARVPDRFSGVIWKGIGPWLALSSAERHSGSGPGYGSGGRSGSSGLSGLHRPPFDELAGQLPHEIGKLPFRQLIMKRLVGH